MRYTGSKTERMARQLGMSVRALEQYLQLKRVEVAPEEPVRQPVQADKELPRGFAGGR